MDSVDTNPAPPLVLVCEDEVHMRRLIVTKLRECGCEVVEARDGRQGLELACSRTPALIITDLQMPALSGIEMCQVLHSRPDTGKVPVLMLTARGYILDPEALNATNIVDVLPKPFGVREFVERVRRLLGTPSRRAA